MFSNRFFFSLLCTKRGGGNELIVDAEECSFDVGESSPGDGARVDVEEFENGRRGNEVWVRGNVVEEGLEHVDAFGDGGFGGDDVLVGEGRESGVERVDARISQDLLIKGIKVIVSLQSVDGVVGCPLAHVCLDINEVLCVTVDLDGLHNGHLHVQVPLRGRRKWNVGKR